MVVEVQVTIDGSREDVWNKITDIENSHKTVSGIQKVEILEQPTDGLVGLKWRETRTLFGKTATEIMWITELKENESYKTRAESHGAVYTTGLVISEQDGKSRLTMTFNSDPRTFGAKMMATMSGIIFKSAMKKALTRDLIDIKAAVEQSD